MRRPRWLSPINPISLFMKAGVSKDGKVWRRLYTISGRVTRIFLLLRMLSGGISEILRRCMPKLFWKLLLSIRSRWLPIWEKIRWLLSCNMRESGLYFWPWLPIKELMTSSFLKAKGWNCMKRYSKNHRTGGMPGIWCTLSERQKPRCWPESAGSCPIIFCWCRESELRAEVSKKWQNMEWMHIVAW